MKNKAVFLGLLLTVFALLNGCGETTKGEDEFLIKGHIKGLEGRTMYLERIMGVQAQPVVEVPLDENGDFEVTSKGEADMIFQLRVDKGGSILFIPEFSRLEIEADADELQAFQVKGNAKTDLIREFNLHQYRLYIDYVTSESQLDGLDRKVDTTEWREREAVTDKAMMAYRDYMRTFCDTVSLSNMRAFAALSLTSNGNYHYLQKLTGRLDKEMPGSSSISELRNAMEKEADLRIGITAPIITSVDQHGKPFDLQALRGKPVLLYFWASYCEFSRVENMKLATFSKLFADNGVSLVCFSLDDTEEIWRKGMQEAGIDWATHIRGLNGTNSTEIGQYLVKAIPSTYLIDADGLIRDLDMRTNEMETDLPAFAKSAGPSTPSVN